MTLLPDILLRAIVASDATADAGADQESIIGAVILIAVLAIFVWLLVAAVRKKLLSSKGRLGDLQEDQEDAAKTARLWMEARRKTEEEDEEEEPEPGEDEPQQLPKDLQDELLERARKRREEQPPPSAGAFQKPSLKLVPPLPPETQTGQPPEKAAPPVQPVAAAEAPAAPRSLEEGLQKTRREGFVSALNHLFGRGTLGPETVEEIEEILFTADIGPRTAQHLIDFLQKELDLKQRSETSVLFTALQGKIREMLEVGASPLDIAREKPLVILVVGVNGTGKTTTIGKLAQRYAEQNKKVILAAGDTFRAAAAEQLEIWGERAKVQVIRGQEGADPGSVIFDAISAAKSQGADIVIADTAGRLHTKVNLIDELRKVQRVCGKALPGAPHEVFLVLDATTGQNAINQAKQFHEALKLTGIVLTKLDGTAKGGVIIGICDSLGIPVRYIGIGESAADLRPFEPETFVKALFA